MRRIVLVVDELKDTASIADITRNDLEGNSREQTLRLEESLCQIAPIVRYTSPAAFEANLNQHSEDIVFPMYYGAASPNSKGIVPALCEAAGISYVGADAYAQIICNDKFLSKQYAANFGVCSPNGQLLRHPSPGDAEYLSHLSLPLIVKPNFGGGSTGISSSNLVYSYQAAADLACKLYQYIKIPIIVEEYVKGYEVELILAGTQKNIRFSEEVQLLMGSKCYFDNDIWGFEAKDIDDSNIDFQISNYISEEDRQNLFEVFKSFQKLEVVRFDGRVQNGRFYLMELSPDCYLGEDCAVAFAFQSKGYTHTEMLRFLIDNALNPD